MFTWFLLFDKYNKEFLLNNMALYLNNARYGSNNQDSQDTLIHSYNKSYFSDYNQAKSVLL